MKTKHRTLLFFALSGLPLLAYPAVAMASLMSLAGYVPEDAGMLEILIPQGFAVLSLAYPLCYLGCLIIVIVSKEEKEKKASTFAPFGYLLLTIGVFLLWLFMGS